jgi:hypothetical protein
MGSRETYSIVCLRGLCPRVVTSQKQSLWGAKYSGEASGGKLDERLGDRGQPVTKIDSDTNNTRKSKAARSSVLRCGREKRPPKDMQINSEISSAMEKYDMNWKLSFVGNTRVYQDLRTPFILLEAMTRGHEPGTVATQPLVRMSVERIRWLETSGLQHSFMSLRVGPSLLIGSRPTILCIYWTEALSIPVHGKLKSATWASELT